MTTLRKLPISRPRINWPERQISDELTDVQTLLFLEAATSFRGRLPSDSISSPTAENRFPEGSRRGRIKNVWADIVISSLVAGYWLRLES